MPPFNPARWFIEGEVDWDAYREWLNKWGPALAGALFAAGWWCWVDALIYQKAVLQAAYPWRYNWPGIGEIRVGRRAAAALAAGGGAGGHGRAAVWAQLLPAPSLTFAPLLPAPPPPQWPRWPWS